MATFAYRFAPCQQTWSTLSNILDQGRFNSELVCLFSSVAATATHGDVPTPTCLASRMVQPRPPDLCGGGDSRQVPVSDCGPGATRSRQDPMHQVMADAVVVEASKPPGRWSGTAITAGRFCRCVQRGTKWRLNDKEARVEQPLSQRPPYDTSWRQEPVQSQAEIRLRNKTGRLRRTTRTATSTGPWSRTIEKWRPDVAI